MEEKRELNPEDTYIDSQGKPHNIDVMARNMVFNTVVKYGKVSLIEKGNQKLVDRFNDLMKEIDVFTLINKKDENAEEQKETED